MTRLLLLVQYKRLATVRQGPYRSGRLHMVLLCGVTTGYCSEYDDGLPSGARSEVFAVEAAVATAPIASWLIG